MKRFCFICCLFLISFPAFSISHVVQKGETLYGLSRKYGLSVSELCAANGMSTNEVLKTGQVLEIPQKNAEKSVNKEQIQKTDSYTVQKGDTLYSISRKFGISVETLSILNKMSGTEIQIGQVISVPLAAVDEKSSSVKSENSSVQKNQNSKTAQKSPDNQKSVNSVNDESQIEDLKLTDSRSYDTKKVANKNLKWPVTPKEIQYVTGKVSGVAISTNENESVKAIYEGNVVFCGVYRGFGNVVFVQNKNGYMYVYSNLAKIDVKEGETVSANQKLGTVAFDSRAEKPQLLLMVFKGSDPIDPAKAPRG